MDPLTIFGAVTGGISAAGAILKVLRTVVATTEKYQAAPELALATLRDVQMVHRNLIGLGRLQHKWRLLPQDRLSCIPLEDAKNTLVDCVSSLDELEDVLRPLDDPSLDAFSIMSRLAWLMNDSRIADLSKRLHNAQSSLGLMLVIMQHESVMEVSTAVTNLAEVTQRIAQDVADILIARGVPGSEGDDTSTLRAPTVQLARPDSVLLPSTPGQRRSGDSASWTSPRFAFEQDLQQSLAYRRIPRWSKDDLSFRSSVLNFHALSFLSNLSLGDVSALSVVALPIFKSDIANNRHYSFGDDLPDAIPVPDQLGPPTGELPAVPAPASHTSTPRASVDAFGLGSRNRSEGVTDSPRHSDYSDAPSSLYSQASDAMLRVSVHNSVQTVLNLGQLSHHLGREHDGHFLTHVDHPWGAPCFGVVATQRFRESLVFRHIQSSPLGTMEAARRMQLKLAAKRGYLDGFRCLTCRLSLAQVVTEEKGDSWARAELWCGEYGCASRLGEATPFKPCACCNDGNHDDDNAGFYGCRNMASMTVQCARCYDQCPGCAEEASRAPVGRKGRLEASGGSPVPASVWRQRLYSSQDMLFASQSRVLLDVGMPEVHVRLALLERESTRFDAVLEELNNRDMLLEERKAARQVLVRHGDVSSAADYMRERMRAVRERLKVLNAKLAEYSQLFGGRISPEHLRILSERKAVVRKRGELIALVVALQGSDPVIQAQLAVYDIRWAALAKERDEVKNMKQVVTRPGPEMALPRTPTIKLPLPATPPPVPPTEVEVGIAL